MNEELSRRYVKARRALIERDYSYLNPEQRRAVLATEGPLLLLAGAGSGKTTVLINRIGNLLRCGRGGDSDELPPYATEETLRVLEEAVASGKKPTDELRALCAVEPALPWQIIAITFTNKAADEMKSRLERVLGPEARDIWAFTFHSACVRILRRDAERIGFPQSFTIYDTSDSLSVMKRVLKEMNVDDKTFPPKAMLGAASRFKDQLIRPEDYVKIAERSGDIRQKRTAEICQSYARRLKDAGAMDFDDLLYYCVRLLQENPDVLGYYQRKFRYVLIDEYQDTNYLQYLFASLLAGGSRNICVVGDDDQSIYKFRGATIENILSFEKQYTDARVIRLEQNYRSTGTILDAANAVIANNTHRKGKRLWTDQGAGDRIVLFTAKNEEDEADYICRTIALGGRPLRDYAVLYRTNAQSRAVELAMKRHQIGYRIFGGTRFFDRAEVKDILAYMCVVANPTDETRLLRIVNVPTRGIGAASLEKAQAIAQEEGKSLFETMENASHLAGLTAGKKMEAFCAMIRSLQEKAAELPLDEFFDALLEETGYVAALENKNEDENLARIENVHELKTSIVKSMEQGDGGDLYSFLDEVALYTDMDNYDKNADAAVMMTMHSAKGLEFPVVFLIGAEEGLFPGLMAVGSEEEMEEERRLCYVAITRAKEKLHITCAAQRMLYGRTNANLPSRFTDEIPAELLDRQGFSYRRRETRDEFGDLAGYGREEYSDYGSDRPHSYGGYSERSYSSRGGYSGYSQTSRTAPRPTAHTAPRPTPTPAPKESLPDFKVGDAVEHKAFGKGKIEKLSPMGGDALVEVAFESGETKKLMLRIASRQMTKL